MSTLILWSAVLLISALVEAATMGLVSIWFAGGALVALIAHFCGAGFGLQVILFFAVSGVLLACLYPFAKKVLKKNRTATNADRIIGMTAIVTEAIDNVEATGAVKVDGKVWSARSTDGTAFAEGEHVKVTAIEGVRAIVEKIPAACL